MPAKRHEPQLLWETLEVYGSNNYNETHTASHLGIPTATFRSRLKAAYAYFQIKDRHELEVRGLPKRPGAKHFTVQQLPDEDMPVEELVEHMKRRFEKKRQHEEARKLVHVALHIDGPYGILHFGDPHVDDDGTDIGLLEHHTELVNKTEGLFAANVGDTTNNWVGRLAKLYAQQGTTASQAWKLAEWFIGRCPWLYIIGGNHDAWSGAGDPLIWIARQSEALYQSSEVRLALYSPNGRIVRVNARHDFAGHSQYNPAHGATKALMFGVRDHIAVAGHKHVSGYNVFKDPHSMITCHALQVSSYKIYDRYAREHGFRDQSLSPCALTVVDPRLPDDHPDMVKVFWDADIGAKYLTFLRDEFKQATNGRK